MLRKIKMFLALPYKQKFMFMEAFFLTAIIRFSILIVAFKRLAKLSGKQNQESTEKLTLEQSELVNQVAYIVNLVTKHTPWQSWCLVKALTTQLMLKRRKITSTLYLGVAKDDNKKLIAHAWLRCGETIITGANERYGFTMVAKFASQIEKVV